MEKKLNGLHALHRSLETKYAQVCKELIKHQSSHSKLSSKHLDTTARANTLAVEKVEISNKAEINEEHVYVLKSELEGKDLQIKDLEAQLDKILKEKDNETYKLNKHEANLNLIEQKIKLIEDEKTNLKMENSTIYESNRRNEILLKKAQNQLENFKQKFSRTELEYQKAEIDIAEINEIKREKDERIFELRNELKDISEKLKQVENKRDKLNIDYDNERAKRSQLDQDYESLNVQYDQVNNKRNELEAKLEDALKRVNNFNKIEEDLKSQIIDLKKSLKETKRSLEFKEERFNQSDKNHMDRIEAISDRMDQLQKEVMTETELKERWIEKHKGICDTLKENENKILDLNNEIHKLQLEINGLVIQIDKKDKSIEQLEKLQKESKLDSDKRVTQIEKLSRGKVSTEKLIESLHQDVKDVWKKYYDKVRELMSSHEHDLDAIQMVHEDLMSNLQRRELQLERASMMYQDQ